MLAVLAAENVDVLLLVLLVVVVNSRVGVPFAEH